MPIMYHTWTNSVMCKSKVMVYPTVTVWEGPVHMYMNTLPLVMHLTYCTLLAAAAANCQCIATNPLPFYLFTSKPWLHLLLHAILVFTNICIALKVISFISGYCGWDMFCWLTRALCTKKMNIYRYIYTSGTHNKCHLALQNCYTSADCGDCF